MFNKISIFNLPSLSWPLENSISNIHRKGSWKTLYCYLCKDFPCIINTNVVWIFPFWNNLGFQFWHFFKKWRFSECEFELVGFQISKPIVKFEPIVLVLTIFSNSKTFKPNLRTGSNFRGTLTLPRSENFIIMKFYNKLKQKFLP